MPAYFTASDQSKEKMLYLGKAWPLQSTAFTGRGQDGDAVSRAKMLEEGSPGRITVIISSCGGRDDENLKSEDREKGIVRRHLCFGP